MALPRGIIQFIWDECCQPPSPYPAPTFDLSASKLLLRLLFPSWLAVIHRMEGGGRGSGGKLWGFPEAAFSQRDGESKFFSFAIPSTSWHTCIKVHAFAVHHILYHASSNCWSKKRNPVSRLVVGRSRLILFIIFLIFLSCAPASKIFLQNSPCAKKSTWRGVLDLARWILHLQKTGGETRTDYVRRPAEGI